MTPLFLTLIQATLVLLLAPFAFGVIRYLKALIVGRRGMNPFLPYVTLATLLKKENLISTSSSWVFRLAPIVTLSCSVLLVLALPLLTVGGAVAFLSHFMIIIGLVNLATVFMILGALDAGSVYGSMGASRQILITSFTLPTFVLIFAAYAITTGETNVDGMLGSGVTLLTKPFLGLAILALILISLAENDRYPVDNPETSLELTMIREAIAFNFSGPYLAMIEYSAMIKLIAFELLITNLILPLPILEVGEGVGDIGLVIFVATLKILISGIVIALLETLVAKMRFYRLQEYLSTAFFLALSGVALVLMRGSI